MSMFLDMRALPKGGEPVAAAEDIKIVEQPPGPVVPAPPISKLTGYIAGKDVLLITHGFNWDQDFGLERFSEWEPWLQLKANQVAVFVLWPGDSRFLPGPDYIVEDKVAYRCGDLLAQYVNANFSGAGSLSCASHSLGVRVLLQMLKGLDRDRLPPLRNLLLMAAAINDDCLTNEYQGETGTLHATTVMCSKEDDVLQWIFPLGNPIAGIFDHGHPWFKGALGRYGPKQTPPRTATAMMPDSWNWGHGSYIKCAWPAPVPNAQDVPLPVPCPAAGQQPPQFQTNGQQAWTAGFAASCLDE